MKNLFILIALVVISVGTSSFSKEKPASKYAASKALVFPVAGKKSKIGDKWGASRGGGKRTHKGIDIFARKGTPVLAVADGVISTKGTWPVGGKVLWLNAEDYSWEAYYAHLDKWLVKEGQYVKKGQVIGTVGNTGNARTTPPHLHFGIKNRNGWVNPLPYVKNATKITTAKVPGKKKSATAKRTSAKKKTAVAKRTTSKKKSATAKKTSSRKSSVAKRSTSKSSTRRR